MRTNRIEGYLGSFSEAGVDTLFWSDFIEDMRKGNIHVTGTVSLEISDEGEFKLNIVLYPDRE